MNPEYPFQPQEQPTPPQNPGQTPGGYPFGQAPQQQPYAQQQYQQQPAQQTPQSPQQPGGYTLPPSNTPHRRRDPGKKWVIMTFVFIFLALAAAGTATWGLVNYFDQKNNVDGKVSSAVALAVKEQKAIDDKAHFEAEKEPNRDFVGPEDYGRVAFQYPKTWSVYEAKNAVSGGTYEAYFSPGVIPPVAVNERYALRLTIENKTYERVIKDYENRVKDGALKSSSVTLGEQNGTRLEGNFTDDIRGTAVVLKIRDKAVTLRTDADTFNKDFNALIATITFNK